eukprot:COSAG02_NODE_65217_length_258_cov_1.056604_1_plen_27_part_10
MVAVVGVSVQEKVAVARAENQKAEQEV